MEQSLSRSERLITNVSSAGLQMPAPTEKGLGDVDFIPRTRKLTSVSSKNGSLNLYLTLTSL
jgi:hypothetical protein